MNASDRRDRLAELAAKLSISATSLSLFAVGSGLREAAIAKNPTDVAHRPS